MPDDTFSGFYICDPNRTEWHDNPINLNADNCLIGDNFEITPLHYALLNPELPIPTDLLNYEVLTTQLPSGLTLLHIAAACQKLNALPDEFLTPENLSVQDHNGQTPIHISVLLAILPKCGLTVDSLTIPDSNGNTPMHLCCFSEWVDKPLFPKLPINLITHRTMLAQNMRGETPLHLLAHAEAFQYLPKDFLTPEILLLADNAGYTVCHHALRAAGDSFSGLEHFPKECLTAEVLLKKDNKGYPSLYYAAQRDLKHLPEEFKTANYFLGDEYDGDTLFHVASSNGTVFDLPALLTSENLLTKGRNGKTPLDNIVEWVAPVNRFRARLGITSYDLEKLLGIDFPDSVKSIFLSLQDGEEWWEKIKAVVRSQKGLLQEEKQYERGELY